MFNARYVVFALMLSGVVACGGDDDKKDETSQVSESSVTVKVSASKGGSVKLGEAALKIPAGALSEDLEVTLEAKKPAKTLPEQDSLQGMTYDFGPNGTEFEKPVELTLPLEGEPGSDQKAVISWYDEDSKTWQDLTATVKDGVISAEVQHFTLFVVRFKGVEAGAFDCGFTACGAEGIQGSWTMTGACFDTGKQENPFSKIAECQDTVFDVGVDAEGEVTFTEDTYDYHWIFAGKMSLDLSADCVAKVSPSGCEAFKFGDDVTCVGAGERCSCTGAAGDPDESMGTGAYSVSGDEITFSEEGETEPDVQKVCVKGDQLKVQQTSTETDDDTGETVNKVMTLVLTRK